MAGVNEMLSKEEVETLNEMPLREWFYLMPAKFHSFMKGLEVKGFVESQPCSFNSTGIKWRKVKEVE